jgi:DNA-binding CsgD family transcriptional regulator
MTDAYLTSERFKRVVVRERDFPILNFDSIEGGKIYSGIKHLEIFFPNSVLVLCKINHPSVSYVSKNCSKILGYTAMQLKNFTPEQYFSLVHPDDARAVRMCYARMEKEMASKNYRPDRWKFSFEYRLQAPDGKYLYIRDEKSCVQYEPNLFIHFSIVQAATTPKPLWSPSLDIYTNTKELSRFRKTLGYVPKVIPKPITAREKEILRCLEIGMRKVEIADHLHISSFTVRNHISNLIKKTNSKTSIQAVHIARNMGWI